jgi:Pectate lyase superfamily protein
MRILPNLRLFLAALAVVLSTQSRSVADIIPANRRMTWTPGVNVGVPGGIPNRTSIFVNVKTTTNSAYHCAGDGVTDDFAALEAAMQACPEGQVVYVPAGTYRLSWISTSWWTQNFTLRGDGPGRTIFLCTDGRGGLNAGSEEYPSPVGHGTTPLPVTSGATKGSTVLTVANASTVTAGNLVTLVMDTPTWMHRLIIYDVPVFRMTFKVVSKTSTTVTITPSIPWDVSGMNPKIIPFGTQGGNNGRVINGVGFEDFTINATNGNLVTPLKIQQSWGCWVKNIEIVGTHSRQIFLEYSCAGEIRKSYFHGTQGTGPNHEGIDLVNECSWNLIEDNICVGAGKPAIVLGDGGTGCVGNVIAYNYVKSTAPEGIFNAGVSDSHGFGGNTLNLYEGNVMNGFNSDGYFGSSSRSTLFRNYIFNDSLFNYGGQIAIDLNHYAVYFNLVGNVIGSPDVASVYETDSQDYSTNTIYRLGYPNTGNFGYGASIGPTDPPDYTGEPYTVGEAQHRDLNVKATLLRHGNFDYAHNDTIWDSSITDHNLPPSLYLGAKPAWWGPSAWPPIGPDRTPMVSQIPAQIRFLSMGNPPSAPARLRIQ